MASELATIIITLDPVTGQVSFQSNITNSKTMMYGMLEVARDIVHDLNEKEAQSRIVSPFPGMSVVKH